MDKEALIRRIEELPLFELKDVAVKETEWVEQAHHKAVTEIGSSDPLAFVWKNYRLVQFKEVFTPLLETLGEADGRVLYFHGLAVMDVFPEDETLRVNGDRVGLVCVNSVNKTSGIIVKFCVRHSGRTFTLPKEIAGYKRMHVGKVVNVTKDYVTLIGKVKNVWGQIIEEFPKVTMSAGYAETMLDDAEIKDKRLRKRLLQRAEDQKMTLWEAFIYLLELIEEKNFKSDLHRRKKIDLITSKVVKWAVATKLINA